MLRIIRNNAPGAFNALTDRPRQELLRWARRAPHERRQRRPPIDLDFFRSEELFKLVAPDFGGRCAFCESDVTPYEGVRHFRPIRVSEGSANYNSHDHYAWLAYEWRNLYLICDRCESTRSDHFYVEGSPAPFLSTLDDVRMKEKPYLIDPTFDSPRQYLSFLMTGECFFQKNSKKASYAVEMLALNSPGLVAHRAQTISRFLEQIRLAFIGDLEIQPDFLDDGPFPGVRRNILARLLDEVGLKIGAADNSLVTSRRLKSFIESSSRDIRDRSGASIELLETADLVKRFELTERPAIHPFWLFNKAPAEPRKFRVEQPNASLRSIEVRNFRAIDSVRFEVSRRRNSKSGSPCLMLLGENSVGKSTCLAAIALALIGRKEAKRLQLRFSDLARSLDQKSWDLWGRQELGVRLELHGGGPVEFLYDPITGETEGTVEQTTLVLGYGPHRYFSSQRADRNNRSSDKVRSLFDPRRPLPDPSDWLSKLDGEEFDQVARTIRMILPIGDDDHLVNDDQYGICVLAQRQLTPISQLSEGYRSVFAMVADICRSLLTNWNDLEAAKAVVLIDEIETHLHPSWKMRVMSSLRRAFPQVQFIATTHDPLCLRGMDDGEVAVMARDENGGVQLLEDLPSVSGMRVEQLLTSEYFGLSSTIDPDMQLKIADLAHRIDVDPSHYIGDEANRLISRLTVGDSATAQIIQDALLKYLRERERPIDSLSPGARPEAVATVFKALKALTTKS